MTVTASPTLREEPRPDIGLRDSARPAWRALVAALVELDRLGIRTPCAEDPAAFLGDDFDLRQQAAKRCGLCPVRAECGTFASANRETVGVWAGRDRTWGAGAELERRRSKRPYRRRRSPIRGEDEHTFTTNTGKSTTYRSADSEGSERVPAGQRAEEHDVQHRRGGLR